MSLLLERIAEQQKVFRVTGFSAARISLAMLSIVKLYSLDFKCFMCLQFSQHVHLMSFGKTFLKIMSALCQMQMTLTEPSI